MWEIANSFLAFAERAAVELDLAACGPLDGLELAEVGAVELVGLAELVHEPHALVRVPDRVRRELRRDQQVDLPPFDLVQVEQPPRESVRQQPLRRVPLERHGDECRIVPARAQLLGRRCSSTSAPPRTAPAGGSRESSSPRDDRVVERREEDL